VSECRRQAEPLGAGTDSIAVPPFVGMSSDPGNGRRPADWRNGTRGPLRERQRNGITLPATGPFRGTQTRQPRQIRTATTAPACSQIEVYFAGPTVNAIFFARSSEIVERYVTWVMQLPLWAGTATLRLLESFASLAMCVMYTTRLSVFS
jgi:hypothetical protein